MAITPAVELADWASGIGTGPLQIDNVTDRVGIGTTAPLALLDIAMSDPTPSGSGITTALLIRHTASSLHALRVEDESHPDFSPFIINSNGRVGIRTDQTDGDTLTAADVSATINIKSTSLNNNGALLLSGRDNSGIAYTSKINARTFGGVDLELDTFASNTRTNSNNYRKLRIYGVGSADTLSEPGAVVAFGGTFRNGPDQVGIASVGIGTMSPLGRFHIDLLQGDLDRATFRIRNTTDEGASAALKLENLYDRDIGLSFRTAETDGDIDSMETRWLIWNDGALGSDERQNGFRVNMVGASQTCALAINTNRRIGFGTDTPEHPLHIYRNAAILACFERQGVSNAGIEFKRSNSGNAARTSMFLGLSDADTFAINDAEDLNSSPFFEINRAGIVSAFAFTSSNTNDTLTNGTAAINLTGATGAIVMDNDGGVLGTKRITFNDGGGNFNIRLNNAFPETYQITNDGAVHLVASVEGASGNFDVNLAAAGTAGDAISWTTHSFDTTGLVLSGCGRLRDNTGDYGSIEISGGNTNGYGGYSIEGAAAFMRASTTGVFGLYDDTNNHWAVYHTPNGETRLYHDGTSKLETTSGGAVVNGELECTQLDVNGPANFSNQGDVTFNGASAQMLWDQSANRLRINDNAELAFGTNSDFRIFHDNVDTFLYFNDRDLYFVDNSPASANIRGTWDSSAGTMLARGGLYSGRYLNASGQTTHTTGGIIGVGNNPVNNSNNLIQLDPRRPSEPGSTDAILYRRVAGPEPAPTGNTAMFTVERNGDVTHAGTSPGPSDARLKTNIVDAPPQWDDIKAMRVRNYNRIDGAAGGIPPATSDIGPATDPSLIEENPKHIGLIAQELLETSPGLVRKKWDSNAWFDDDGNEVDEFDPNAKHVGVSSTSTDNWTYHVRQQPITYKMLKALQETMFKVEVLEIRLNNAGIALT